MFKIIFGNAGSNGTVYIDSMADALAFGLIMEASGRFALILEADKAEAVEFALANLPERDGNTPRVYGPRVEPEVLKRLMMPQSIRPAVRHRRFRKCECPGCMKKSRKPA